MLPLLLMRINFYPDNFIQDPDHHDQLFGLATVSQLHQFWSAKSKDSFAQHGHLCVIHLAGLLSLPPGLQSK